MDLDSESLNLETDLTRWEVGPYHAALPGPMKLYFSLEGEVVVRSQVEIGFNHRGIEKACETQKWSALLVYADRLDPEQAIFSELAVCLAAEEIGSLDVPLRARGIRMMVSELSRIASHLLYVGKVARALGSDTLLHYVLRDREKVLDLFELLTGARFSPHFLRFGGVKFDVSDGFLERILQVCEAISQRIKEYNDIFTFNSGFIKRASALAPISLEQVQRYGVSGPNARAAGYDLDYRIENRGLGYAEIDFVPVLGRGQVGIQGDVHDRFLIRLLEISQSIEILKQVVDGLPGGDYCSLDPDQVVPALPAGESYSRVESSRGLLGCHLVSEGHEKPARVQFRTPSLFHLSIVPELMRGARLEDFPLILASLDLGVAEADR